MSLINAKNLIVDFDIYNSENEVVSKKRVLDGINLSINQSEFVCILGRNGGGKSTLAKCLNGLIKPSSGSVLIDGLDTANDDNLLNIRQMVGMAFQNPDNQIVASIVEEDIAFGMENIGIETSEMNIRIDDALKNLGISHLKYSMVSKLSGGQKQKVSIAGILAMKSKIIVLDEPTSMIDKAGRTDLLNILKKINVEDKITIVLISHYIEEIMYANRVIVLDKGIIKANDTPKNILLQKDVLMNAGIDLPYIPALATRLKENNNMYKGNETTVEELCQYLI